MPELGTEESRAGNGGPKKERSPHWPIFWATIIAALIGAAAVLIDDDSGGSDAVAPVSAARESQPQKGGEGPSSGTAEGIDRTKGTDSGKSETQPSSASSGNSRSEARRIAPGETINATLNAGNDVDWYVYRAAKDEATTIEIVKGDGKEAFGGILVYLSEGIRNLEADEVSPGETTQFRRNVSSGAVLYLEVSDICSDQGGCGVGPYSVALETGPVG